MAKHIGTEVRVTTPCGVFVGILAGADGSSLYLATFAGTFALAVATITGFRAI